MSEEIRELVNSPFLWVITVGGLSLVLGLALFYIVRSIQAVKYIGVTKEQITTTLKTSCLSAIGPKSRTRRGTLLSGKPAGGFPGSFPWYKRLAFWLVQVLS